MQAVQIKSETFPARCEICHQQDWFIPQQNYCVRCVDAKPNNLPERPNLKIAPPQFDRVSRPRASSRPNPNVPARGFYSTRPSKPITGMLSEAIATIVMFVTGLIGSFVIVFIGAMIIARLPIQTPGWQHVLILLLGIFCSIAFIVAWVSLCVRCHAGQERERVMSKDYILTNGDKTICCKYEGSRPNGDGDLLIDFTCRREDLHSWLYVNFIIKVATDPERQSSFNIFHRILEKHKQGLFDDLAGLEEANPDFNGSGPMYPPMENK